MAEEAINPLRRRMIEDMTFRNFDLRMQATYIRSVRSCCRYCDRRPQEHIPLLSLKRDGVKRATGPTTRLLPQISKMLQPFSLAT